MERDVALGGEHKIKYTDDVPQNCKHETYKILLTNVTPIKSDHFLKGNKNYVKRVHYCIYQQQNFSTHRLHASGSGCLNCHAEEYKVSELESSVAEDRCLPEAHGKYKWSRANKESLHHIARDV